MSDFLAQTRPILLVIGSALVLIAALFPLFEPLLARLGLAGYRLPSILRRARTPLRVVLLTSGLEILFEAFIRDASGWSQTLRHILALVLIGAIIWLVIALVLALEDIVLGRIEKEYTGDAVHVRQARTQVTLLRRLIVAFLIIIGLAAMLTTFPEVNVIGRSLFASAGLISIVAGLAAQTTLTNLFASIQLAMSNALRVDDVVVVEGESGTVAEMTLTYVVIALWDGRRLILPSSYFVSQPFENWTRSRDQIGGNVTLDVDWTVPVPELRAELTRVLDETPLWDGRRNNLVVADATSGSIRIRIDVSAADTLSLLRLRNHVREAMVTYLASRGGGSLPRTRMETVRDAGPMSPDSATDDGLRT